MRDFWVGSGHHLLDRDEAGRLRVTDAFLKAYLARPELVPPEDACEAELMLHHELLMHHPRRPVGADEIAAMQDADARENWRFMIAFRDRLLAAPTLDAAYVTLARGAEETPPLFMNQLAQVVLRSALEGERDPWVLRAAELFYRPQRVSFHDGAMLLADAETIELHEQDHHASPLLAMFDGPAVDQLEILDDANAEGYFARSDAFDMVLEFGMGGAGRRGLAAAMAAWVRHLLAVEVEIEPVDRVEDDNWAWFVGLDAEATRIGNTLWNGSALDAEEADRIVALFRLSFANPGEVLQEVGARPVWLILAMSDDRTIRMKPQNLIAGLPLRAQRRRIEESAMARDTMKIGVIVERRVLDSVWADHAWKSVTALAGAPSAAPWTVLSEAPRATRYYAGAFELEFFGSDTTMYRENLRSGRPSLWVSLRPAATPPGVVLKLVTADPSEAEALTEPGTDVIDTVPMPREVQERLAAFVEAHHVERPFVKRKRDRANPEAMASRQPK